MNWDDKLHYSSEVIAFHGSMFHHLEALNTHNVAVTANTEMNAKKSWSVLHDARKRASQHSVIDQSFNFCVHGAGMMDDTAAPSGCDSIMVLVPCPISNLKKWSFQQWHISHHVFFVSLENHMDIRWWSVTFLTFSFYMVVEFNVIIMHEINCIEGK